MSVVRLVPRCVVVFAAVLLISACAARNAPAPGPNPFRGNPCAGGAVPGENRQAPIVCIDDSGRKLRAYPDPVFVHDVKESDHLTPVEIQWYTTSGIGDVRVEMESGCVTEKQCDHNGKCAAKTIKGANKRCKYDVWIEGDAKHDRLDPVVVITTCC
jgi:hypothetical protein